MTDIDRLFDATRKSTLGGADSISFEWWHRTSRLAFDAQDWPTALDRLARLGDLVKADDEARTAVLGLALTACIRGNVPGRVETAIAQWNSVPGLYFDLLRGAVDLAATQDTRSAEITLDLVSKRLPYWPYVWSACGERYDRLGQWALSAAAWQKAEAGLGERAVLRVGVAAMHAGNVKQGRESLRQITPDAQNFAWVMTGWVASHRWFDRLRAYDALDDVLAAELRAEPGLGRPALSIIQDTLRAILLLIPPLLSNDEYERLDELVRKAFDPLESAAAIQRLQARLKAAQVHPEGEEAQNADATLARLAGQPSDETNVTRLMDLAAAGTLSASDVEEILALPSAQWGPLHAIWLNLKGPDMAIELESPFMRWIASARRPEVGWIPVVEHFMARGLFFAGKQALRRAMREGEFAPEDLFETLLEQAVSHSAENDTENELHWWLSQAGR